MIAKQYLSKIRIYRRILHAIELRMEELRTQAEGLRAIVYDKDRVQVSPSNQIEEVMVKLTEVQEKYAANVLKYHCEILKREKQIADMPNKDHAQVLYLRYIAETEQGEQMSLEEIACRMHLSFYRVAHLHGEALQAFQRRFGQS